MSVFDDHSEVSNHSATPIKQNEHDRFDHEVDPSMDYSLIACHILAPSILSVVVDSNWNSGLERAGW